MKTALVTGGSGDIGSAICRRLAAGGCAVAIGYNASKDAAEALCKELRDSGAAACAVRIDLCSTESIDAAVSEIKTQLSAPEVLVNCAGTAHIGLFTDMTDTELTALMQTDPTGHMLLTKRIVPDMVRRGKGRIINISSVWGLCGASCEAAYSAAKAGLIGFTKALGKELAPSGITVNCIAAGLIDTKMNASLTAEEIEEVIAEIPAGRAGTPEDIAALCSFLASDDAAYITAQTIAADGGWT